jgi:uncharacterized membrane protein YeaQ/YmgE (transglycosylase-associated protein family)
MILGICAWLLVSLAVGFIAVRMVNLHGDDRRLGSAPAFGGGIVAAGLYTLFSGTPIYAGNRFGLMWAVIGATAGVLIWHLLRSRFQFRRKYAPKSAEPNGS